MAAKPVTADKKRKATPSSKGRTETKKAKLEGPRARAAQAASKDVSSDSDPDDGGVKLKPKYSDKFKKTNTAPPNVFDRSAFNISYTQYPETGTRLPSVGCCISEIER